MVRMTCLDMHGHGRTAFSVDSAQQHGLLCEVDNEEEEEDKELCDPFFAHCKVHADRDLAKRKVSVIEVGVWLCVYSMAVA